MRAGRVSTALVAAALSGCVHYAPAPLHPEQFPAALEARRLDERPAGAAWSQADLLSAALKRSPQIIEARARYATAVAAARTAKLTPALTLTLTAEYADEHPRWGYGGAADIPFDAGVRRSARMTNADLQALRAWYDYAEAVWAVHVALETAQVDLQSADQEIVLADRAAELRRARLQRLERRVAAGEDDRVLALGAQSDLASVERRQAAARGRREQAMVALAKALGVGRTALGDLVLAHAVDPPPPGDFSIWRRDAASSRSDVLRAIADYDLAENALRLEVARQYPEARLGPAYNYDHGVNKFPFNLSLALPTYDLNRRAIDQAELARSAAGRSLEKVQADALAAADAAIQARRSAEADLERAESRALPAARRAAESTARSLQAGAADRVDDLASQAAELDAEMDVQDARRAVRKFDVDLEDALRRPFDPAVATVLSKTLTPPGGVR